jgi:hypothetical protein
MVQRRFVSTSHYEKVLEIRCRQLGENNIDSAATAFNAGQSLHQLGQYDRALGITYFFVWFSSNFEEPYRDIAVVLSGIAQIHTKKAASSNRL